MLEDPKEYLDRRMKQAAESYVDGLQRTGLSDTPIIQRAYFERAINEAHGEYVENAIRVRDEHIAAILKNYKQRDRQFRREGAKRRICMCPPIALAFSLLAWYSFSQQDLAMGIVFVAAALAFLSMLVFGAIFDNLQK